MEPETKVTPEQLEEATKSYAKVGPAACGTAENVGSTPGLTADTLLQALELRDSEPETAVELLGKVLETRNKAYGEKALESADVYLYYGELLFEQAQVNRVGCTSMCLLHGEQHAATRPHAIQAGLPVSCSRTSLRP